MSTAFAAVTAEGKAIAAQLARVLGRVAAAEAAEEALEALLRGALDLLGGRAGTVRLVDPETSERLLSLDIEELGEPRWDAGREGLKRGSIGAGIAAGGPAVLIEDFAELPDSYPLREEMLALGRRSAVNVPMDAAGRRIGSLHVNHTRAGFFTAADLALAEALAALAGGAIERTRLAAERTERARLDAALLVARTVAHEINNALSPITGYAELLSASPTVAAHDATASYARRILWASVEVAEKVKQLQRIIRLEKADLPSSADMPVLDLERSTAAG